MSQVTKYRIWLLASVALNAYLLWVASQMFFAKGEAHAAWERELNARQQTIHTLYRVLPKAHYTRNEFAIALVLPGGVPTVRDCLVQFGNDVFVFDRTNTIIGMYPSGPNPFAPEGTFDAGYRCNAALLNAQTERRTDAENVRKRERDIRNARALVQQIVEQDDPAWGRR